MSILAHGVLIVTVLNLPMIAEKPDPNQILVLAGVIYVACAVAADRFFAAAGDPVAKLLTQCACHVAAAAMALFAGVPIIALISGGFAVRRFIAARNAG